MIGLNSISSVCLKTNTSSLILKNAQEALKSQKNITTSNVLMKEWKGIEYDSSKLMWKEQKKVPRLPVPTLKETCDRYLTQIEPLLSPADFQTTKNFVNEFQTNGEGERLQNELVQLSKDTPTSWLEGFWDTMYLEIRDSNMININPFLILKNDPQRKGQIERASSMISGCLKFYQKIRSETVEPDMERIEPLDMSQYLRLFATTRIPKWRRDVIETYPDARNIIVMSRNQFFSMDVLKKDGTPISDLEIQEGLKAIQSQTDATATPLAALTTEDRNRWASIRSSLISNETNKKSLETIDKALFVIVLEDVTPSNWNEMSQSILHRDGTNRWYDKFVIVSYPDGQIGNVFEHSPVDGHTVLRLWTEVDAYLANTKPETSTTPVAKPTFNKLKWELTDEHKKAIDTAVKNANAYYSQLESSAMFFTDYGKNYITSKKVSPDAYIQMAFQLAYYKLTGNEYPASTYESANTKRFLSGRTETVRTVSKESVNFTKTWTNPKATKEEKYQSLKAAAEAHVQRMNLCKNGFGVDRHLFGLRNLALHKQQKLPRYNYPGIFSDPNYSNFCSNVLSTSNVSSPVFELFGFGPVTGNGLGLAYNIHNNTLRFNVTSFIGQAKAYTTKLDQTLKEMKEVLDQCKV